MGFAAMKNTVFRYETPWILVEVYRRLREAHRFHLQSGSISLLARFTVRP
jgi:hypothetical protein